MITGIVVGFVGCLVIERIVLRLLYWAQKKFDHNPSDTTGDLFKSLSPWYSRERFK